MLRNRWPFLLLLSAGCGGVVETEDAVGAQTAAVTVPSTTGTWRVGGQDCSQMVANGAPITQICNAHEMPLYDQTNPNFAFVTVPFVTWDLEQDRAGENNPYRESWLPRGPYAGDLGSLVGTPKFPNLKTKSELCAPTAISMAFATIFRTTPAGWTIKSPLVQIYKASKPYAAQEDFPMLPSLPNLFSPDSLQRPAVQMQSWELQRVVDVAVERRTDPTSGGGQGAFIEHGDHICRDDACTTHASTRKINDDITMDTIKDFVLQGYVGTLGFKRFTVHISDVKADRMRHVTFEPKDSGHTVAIAGFQDVAGMKMAYIHNPMWGAMQLLYFVTLRDQSVWSKDGTWRKVFLPNREDGSQPSAWGLWPFGQDGESYFDVYDLHDGDTVGLIGSVNGMAIP